MLQHRIQAPQSTPLPSNRTNQNSSSVVTTPNINIVRSSSETSTPIKRMINGGKTSVNLTTEFSLTQEELEQEVTVNKLSRQPSFEIKSTLSKEECYLSFDDDINIKTVLVSKE